MPLLSRPAVQDPKPITSKPVLTVLSCRWMSADGKHPVPGRAAVVRMLMAVTGAGRGGRICRAHIVFRGRKVGFMRCGSAVTQVSSFEFVAAPPCSYRERNYRNTCDAV
jgi:hypothetical protein